MNFKLFYGDTQVFDICPNELGAIKKVDSISPDPTHDPARSPGSIFDQVT
ncbi:MAG: hypothetical protein PVJ20_06440 [Desulfobacterales bacterium]|jgi:hypothetical protein